MSHAPPPPIPQQSPYLQAGYPQPEQGKRSGCGCVLMVLGILALVGFLVCAGCAGFLYFGAKQGFQQLEAEMGKNAVIQEHIGDVQETEIDWSALMKEGGQGSFRMKIKGTKGEGTVVMKQEPGQPEPEFVLETADGESIPIVIEGAGGGDAGGESSEEIDGSLEGEGNAEPQPDLEPQPDIEPQPDAEDAPAGAP